MGADIERDRDKALGGYGDPTAGDTDNEANGPVAVARSAATRARHAADAGARGVPVMIQTAREQADMFGERLPDLTNRARDGVRQTNRMFQSMSDVTLRQIAAGSAGLAAGLYLAGAPRLFALVAAAPGLMAVQVIATRPGRQTAR